MGGLSGLGLTEEHARHIQGRVAEGRSLVAVSVDSDAREEQARGILIHAGAEEVSGATVNGGRQPNTPEAAAGDAL